MTLSPSVILRKKNLEKKRVKLSCLFLSLNLVSKVGIREIIENLIIMLQRMVGISKGMVLVRMWEVLRLPFEKMSSVTFARNEVIRKVSALDSSLG